MYTGASEKLTASRKPVKVKAQGALLGAWADSNSKSQSRPAPPVQIPEAKRAISAIR
jgi:hypothetical protein